MRDEHIPPFLLLSNCTYQLVGAQCRLDLDTEPLGRRGFGLLHGKQGFLRLLSSCIIRDKEKILENERGEGEARE